MPYINDYLQIVCAIINAFRSTYVQDFKHDDEIAKIMIERKNKNNSLEKKLDNKEFLKIKNWKELDGAVTALDFPILSKHQIEELTIGTFQVKQAYSYTNEHIDENGQYQVFISTKEDGLLFASIQSKHSNRKQYYALIKYTYNTIQEWCCQCPNGNRTIGCCSHVCSIIWFLAYARHTTTQSTRIPKRFDEYMMDSSNLSSSEEDDNDDDTTYELVD